MASALPTTPKKEPLPITPKKESWFKTAKWNIKSFIHPGKVSVEDDWACKTSPIRHRKSISKLYETIRGTPTKSTRARVVRRKSFGDIVYETSIRNRESAKTEPLSTDTVAESNLDSIQAPLAIHDHSTKIVDIQSRPSTVGDPSHEGSPPYKELGCCICTKRPKTPNDWLCELIRAFEGYSAVGVQQCDLVNSSQVLDSIDSPQYRLQPPPNTPEAGLINATLKDLRQDFDPGYRERADRREREYKDLCSGKLSLKEHGNLSTSGFCSSSTPEACSIKADELIEDIDPEHQAAWRDRVCRDLHSASHGMKENRHAFVSSLGSPTEAVLLNLKQSSDDVEPDYLDGPQGRERAYRDLTSGKLSWRECRRLFSTNPDSPFWDVETSIEAGMPNPDGSVKDLDPFASSLGSRYREREAWKSREFRDLCSGRLSLREYRDHLTSGLGFSFWAIVDTGASLLEKSKPLMPLKDIPSPKQDRLELILEQSIELRTPSEAVPRRLRRESRKIFDVLPVDFEANSDSNLLPLDRPSAYEHALRPDSVASPHQLLAHNGYQPPGPPSADDIGLKTHAPPPQFVVPPVEPLDGDDGREFDCSNASSAAELSADEIDLTWESFTSAERHEVTHCKASSEIELFPDDNLLRWDSDSVGSQESFKQPQFSGARSVPYNPQPTSEEDQSTVVETGSLAGDSMDIGDFWRARAAEHFRWRSAKQHARSTIEIFIEGLRNAVADEIRNEIVGFRNTKTAETESPIRVEDYLSEKVKQVAETRSMINNIGKDAQIRRKTGSTNRSEDFWKERAATAKQIEMTRSMIRNLVEDIQNGRAPRPVIENNKDFLEKVEATLSQVDKTGSTIEAYVDDVRSTVLDIQNAKALETAKTGPKIQSEDSGDEIAAIKTRFDATASMIMDCVEDVRDSVVDIRNADMPVETAKMGSTLERLEYLEGLMRVIAAEDARSKLEECHKVLAKYPDDTSVTPTPDIDDLQHSFARPSKKQTPSHQVSKSSPGPVRKLPGQTSLRGAADSRPTNSSASPQQKTSYGSVVSDLDGFRFSTHVNVLDEVPGGQSLDCSTANSGSNELAGSLRRSPTGSVSGTREPVMMLLGVPFPRDRDVLDATALNTSTASQDSEFEDPESVYLNRLFPSQSDGFSDAMTLQRSTTNSDSEAELPQTMNMDHLNASSVLSGCQCDGTSLDLEARRRSDEAVGHPDMTEGEARDRYLTIFSDPSVVETSNMTRRKSTSQYGGWDIKPTGSRKCENPAHSIASSERMDLTGCGPSNALDNIVEDLNLTLVNKAANLPQKGVRALVHVFEARGLMPGLPTRSIAHVGSMSRIRTPERSGEDSSAFELSRGSERMDLESEYMDEMNSYDTDDSVGFGTPLERFSRPIFEGLDDVVEGMRW